MPRFAVILVAAGSSARFGSNKLLADLRGMSVFDRSLAAFGSRADVAQVVVPTLTAELGSRADIVVCEGGACRAQSVLNALARVDTSIDWVAIHDAARPLVSQELIDRTFEAAFRHGAAGPAQPVTLTIKQAGSSLPAPIERTVARNGLYAMQTPQIMRRLDLIDAFARCPIALEEVTDDLQLLELVGKPTWLVPGDERNIKITRPIDLTIAAALLDEAALGT